MLTGEPSYFNFLMTNRGLRRSAVRFARATDALPELARAIRATRANVRVCKEHRVNRLRDLA
jgi:hypothetical protein